MPTPRLHGLQPVERCHSCCPGLGGLQRSGDGTTEEFNLAGRQGSSLA